MAGHKTTRNWGADIEQVRFKRLAASKQELLRVEKKYIHEVGKLVDDKSRNINHSPTTWHKDLLENLLEKPQQQRWLANPVKFNRASKHSLKAIPEQQRTKYSKAFAGLQERQHSEEIIELLELYLESCVPVPRLTEFHGWSVNVGSKKNGRAICVSVGKMETLVVFHGTEGFRGFVNVRKSVIRGEAGLLYFMKRPWRGRLWPWAGYVDAGGDCARLSARNSAEFRALLSDAMVQQGAARLVLDLMRKHPCVYTRYHCPQIVEAVYRDQSRDTPAPGPESVSL